MSEHRSKPLPNAKAGVAREMATPQVPGNASVAADRDWAQNRIANFFKGQRAAGEKKSASAEAKVADEKAVPINAKLVPGADAKILRSPNKSGSDQHASKPADGGEKGAPSKKAHGAGPQKTSDIEQLYKDAAVAQASLGALAQAIAQQCHGQTKDPGLKGRARAMEKIKADYSGDVSKIIDVSRASIVLKTADDIKLAVKLVQERAKVFRMKDRFASPVDGYRDVMFNLEMPNGHICELQVQLESIQQVKEGDGHKLYDQIRKFKDKAKLEKRDLTAEEKQQVAKLTAQMKGRYDDAYASAEKGKR
jgi:hypothetical protein